MRSKLNQPRRATALAAGLLAAAALAACGGSTESNDFTAQRVIAFGDESSVLVDSGGTGNGRKYSVNAVASSTDPSIECSGNRLWIQRLAEGYDLVFPECNHGTTAVTDPQSRIRAVPFATSADLKAQIDAQVAAGGFRDDDISTVLIGVHDVLAEYAKFPGVGETQLVSNVEARAEEVAAQVNRLYDTDTRIIVSTIPDIGYSPFAVAEKAAHGDVDRAELLRTLTLRFNARLRRAIVNDGRRIGLVLMDEFVQAVAKNPGLNGFTNSTVGACDLTKSTQVPPSTLDCTTLTLKSGAGQNSFLWADGLRLSAGGQSSLGNLALQRASNNPF